MVGEGKDGNAPFPRAHLLFKGWLMLTCVCVHPPEPRVNCPDDFPFFLSDRSLSVPSAGKVWAWVRAAMLHNYTHTIHIVF